MLKYHSSKNIQILTTFLLLLISSTYPVLPRFANSVTFLMILAKTANLANCAKIRQIRVFQEEKLT